MYEIKGISVQSLEFVGLCDPSLMSSRIGRESMGDTVISNTF